MISVFLYTTSALGLAAITSFISCCIGYHIGKRKGHMEEAQHIDRQLMALQMEQRQQVFGPPVILPFEDHMKGPVQ